LTRRQAVVVFQTTVETIGQAGGVDRDRVGIGHIFRIEGGDASGGHGFSPHQAAADAQCGRGGGVAVIVFVGRGHAGGQGLGRDVGGGCGGGVDQAVVTGIRARQCDATHGHGFAVGCVFVTEQAGGAGDGQQVGQVLVAAEHIGGGGGAVIRLVVGRRGDRQVFGRDVGRCREAVGQAVVAGQATVGAVGQDHAVDGHGFASAHIFIVESRGAGGRDGLAADQTGDAANRGAGCRGLVIDLVAGSQSRRQRFRCDRAGGAGLVHHVVVGQVGTCVFIGQADGLVGAHVLAVTEHTAAAAQAQAVAADLVAVNDARGDRRGGGGAVVSAAGPGDAADGQGALGDVGGGAAGRAAEAVVAAVGARQGYARHRDGFAGGHVFIAEHGGATDGQHIPSNPVIGHGDGGDGRAVIHLVLPGIAQAQGFGGDVAGGGGAGAAQAVVGRVRAGQAQAGGRDGFAGAHIFVGKEGAAGHGGDQIVVKLVGAQLQGGGGRAVIHLVVGIGHQGGHGQGFGRHSQGAVAAAGAIAQQADNGRGDGIAARFRVALGGRAVAGQTFAQALQRQPCGVGIDQSRHRGGEGAEAGPIDDAATARADGQLRVLAVNQVQAGAQGLAVIRGRGIAVVAEPAAARTHIGAQGLATASHRSAVKLAGAATPHGDGFAGAQNDVETIGVDAAGRTRVGTHSQVRTRVQHQGRGIRAAGGDVLIDKHIAVAHRNIHITDSGDAIQARHGADVQTRAIGVGQIGPGGADQPQAVHIGRQCANAVAGVVQSHGRAGAHQFQVVHVHRRRLRHRANARHAHIQGIHRHGGIQCHPAGATGVQVQVRATAADVDRAADDDVVVGIQSQVGRAGAGAARDGRTDRDVARFCADARGADHHIGARFEQAVDGGIGNRRAAAAGRPGAAALVVVQAGRGDFDVPGVKQPSACLACGCTGVALHAVGVQLVARGFNAAAVAAQGAAPRQQLALHLGAALGVTGVGPDHHGAAVAFVQRRCIQHSTGFHDHFIGLANQRVLALPVATDQDLAATALATGIDPCLAREGDFVAGHHHLAALAARGHTSGADLATHVDQTLRAAIQKHAAFATDQGQGFNRAALLNHAAQDGIRAACRQDHQAAIGPNDLLVDHQGVHHRLLDQHRHQLAVGELQNGFRARSQGHCAFTRQQHTFIAHLGGQQGDVATQGRGDLPLVHHRALLAVDGQGCAKLIEIFVGNRLRGGHQTGHIHLGCGTKQHTGRVADEHLAIGAQAAQNLTRVGVEHPVQHHSVGIGLVELHRGLAANIETVPIKHRAVAGLPNG